MKHIFDGQEEKSFDTPVVSRERGRAALYALCLGYR